MCKAPFMDCASDYESAPDYESAASLNCGHAAQNRRNRSWYGYSRSPPAWSSSPVPRVAERPCSAAGRAGKMLSLGKP
jgi:hypothetical protein